MYHSWQKSIICLINFPYLIRCSKCFNKKEYNYIREGFLLTCLCIEVIQQSLKHTGSLQLQLPGRRRFSWRVIKCEGIHLTFQDSPWEHNYKSKREEIRVMEAGVWRTVLESCPGPWGLGNPGILGWRQNAFWKKLQKAYYSQEVSH